MADNPQETVRELRELVIAYAKQETWEPLKRLRWFAVRKVAGGIFIGFGTICVAMGILRLLQGWGPNGSHFSGNATWAPYAIVLGGLLVVIALSMLTAYKLTQRAKRKRAATLGRRV